MAKVDPTAVVEGEVELADGVEIGPFSILRGRIKIGKNTKVGARVSIYHSVEIGQNCTLHDGCVIGSPPQHLRDAGKRGRVVIGDNTVIREFVTVNRGTDESKSATTFIGNGVYLMAYAHVAHDCTVEDGVIMANAATLGGHVRVGRGAFLGGLSAVHQRCSVGEYAMVGGLTGVNKNVPPFTIAAGNHVFLSGINVVGLKRAGFTREEINALKVAYRKIFSSNRRLVDAAAEVLKTMGHLEVVRRFCEFILERSKDRCGVAVDKKLKQITVGK